MVEGFSDALCRDARTTDLEECEPVVVCVPKRSSSALIPDVPCLLPLEVIEGLQHIDASLLGAVSPEFYATGDCVAAAKKALGL
ncbi:MAG: hypothetical protein KHY83_09640 [Coriobacteriia bacterium]|nr:hypothetical protein [Coriobacteriia bacterium]